jgi:hypothetical protein
LSEIWVGNWVNEAADERFRGLLTVSDPEADPSLASALVENTKKILLSSKALINARL